MKRPIDIEKLKALVAKWRVGDPFFPRGGITNSLYEEVADELEAVIKEAE